MANKIIPARGAARKAAASFSKQLASSPVTSDDERASYGRAKGRRTKTLESPSKRKRSSSSLRHPQSDSDTPVRPGPRISQSSQKRGRDRSDWSDGDDISISSTRPPLSTSYRPIPKPISRDEAWNIDRLGDHVWVLVNINGDPSETGVQENGEQEECLWWPGKVRALGIVFALLADIDDLRSLTDHREDIFVNNCLYIRDAQTRAKRASC